MTKVVQIALLAILLLVAFITDAADLSSPAVAPDELNRLLARPDPPLVIDVRSPHEYSAGHIPGSVNIPVPLLRKKLIEIKRVEDLVLYCNDSRLTRLAERILVNNQVQGFAHLEGGFEAWENGELSVETSLR